MGSPTPSAIIKQFLSWPYSDMVHTALAIFPTYLESEFDRKLDRYLIGNGIIYAPIIIFRSTLLKKCHKEKTIYVGYFTPANKENVEDYVINNKTIDASVTLVDLSAEDEVCQIVW